jgi:aquaporin Z
MSEDDYPDVNRSRPEPAAVLAELLGTFGLTAVAVLGAAMGAVTGSDSAAIAKAVAPGLFVLAWIYALGDASGAHVNPAVTVGFALRGVFPWRWVPWYWAAQLAGAIGAGAVGALAFGAALDAGVTRPHVGAPIAVGLELFLTWLLVTVILGTADRFRIVGANAALAVGATIALDGLTAEPLTGASMNPARSLGPAIVAGDLSAAWIYLVGPFLGVVLAVAITNAIHGAGRGGSQVEAATGDKSA